jgi:hypothetical protein
MMVPVARACLFDDQPAGDMVGSKFGHCSLSSNYCSVKGGVLPKGARGYACHALAEPCAGSLTPKHMIALMWYPASHVVAGDSCASTCRCAPSCCCVASAAVHPAVAESSTCH